MNQPTPIRVYGVPFSVHTRKVLVALRLKALPYELVPVVPVDPSTLPTDWRSLSPTGLIPVIDDDGFLLSDSTAIALYLDRKVPEPALLPRALAAYGEALALDAWAGSQLFRRLVHPLFFNQVVAAMRKQPGDRAAIAEALEHALPDAFGYLERAIDGSFLVGDGLSLADLAVVSNLLTFHYLGHRIDAQRYPKLRRYFDGQLGSTALAAVLRDEKPVVESAGLDARILS